MSAVGSFEALKLIIEVIALQSYQTNEYMALQKLDDNSNGFLTNQLV